MRRLPLCLLTALLASACASPHLAIGEGDRQRVIGELEGRRRFTRVALYDGDFFGDRNGCLLSDQPFAELDLIEHPDGSVIPPPEAGAVIPPGTPVRVEKVEFPTGWTIAQRMVMTPRYQPWIHLSVKGEPRRCVLVLPQDLRSREDALAEVARVLTTDDPSPRLAALPTAWRDAVLKKELLEGMSPAAVELSWGVPDKRHIDRPAHAEDWSWAGGRRRASFADDRLVKFEKVETPPKS
ncbi:MAG TPA: hypothetical protein VFE30_03255 [Anaeromyxobacteraceae bacterium]|jgi:hypothetical protein|nr:hypothetical protein [Anaeromyxobacteraceae bacterium]